MLRKLNNLSLGFMAIIVIAGVSYFSINDFSAQGENKYYGQFESINGVNKSTSVYMNGVKIGNVSNIGLKDGFANVEIAVKASVKIPTDSTLLIATNDIFSPPVLSISPGFEEEYMTNNQAFYSVQNSVDFLGLLNEYLDGKIAEKKESN